MTAVERNWGLLAGSRAPRPNRATFTYGEKASMRTEAVIVGVAGFFPGGGVVAVTMPFIGVWCLLPLTLVILGCAAAGYRAEKKRILQRIFP